MPSAILKAMGYAMAGINPYGKIGLYCHNCGELLQMPYAKCGECGYSNSTYDLHGKTMCTACGKTKPVICGCGDPYCEYTRIGCECDSPHFSTITSTQHKNQFAILKGGSTYLVKKQAALNVKPITIGG